MSLYSTLGAEKNLLEETPEHARMLRANRPIITDEELERIRADRDARLLGAHAADALQGRRRRARVCAARSTRSAARPTQAVRDGVNMLILSDRGVTPDLAPIPMLLATGRRAPPPRPRRTAHAVRARLRDRRGARGRALRAADRLRRRRDQSVPRVRDDRGARRGRHLRARWSRRRQGASRTTSRRATRACSRPSRRWGSRRCRAIAARRSSRPWGSIASSSSAASRAPRRASRVSATT